MASGKRQTPQTRPERTGTVPDFHVKCYLGSDNRNVPDYFYLGKLIGVPLETGWWTTNDATINGSKKK
ncbi:hypothetical protein N7491_006770 [Penicillium cf. griseofulvum]|uniref:Uncharacterized protein n=1 Tax=Penicillium cf. griseofulvum TaxID=2972120 RepID=A0A9W9IXJ0_9EURO|nr:hypothetical protein N7472_010201 [Penicillium cf. griseofulvum]KAJ5429754.1 hypothetical protein N7491_006770 [Penicillium cf. griseofulvum]KAJ5436477.1 hypothetical protein N7445_007362 [Penicillium cf. griseofulvum]